MQQVRAYRYISVRPVAGLIGAEIENVNLADLTDEIFEEITWAFADHLCIFFRDQRLDRGHLEEIARRFGVPEAGGYSGKRDETKSVSVLLREANHEWGERNDGDIWHFDLSFRDCPSALAGLYSVETPSHGGDTMFSSMYAAFEELSPGMQEICMQLSVMHSASGLFGTDGRGGPGHMKAMRPDMLAALTEEQAQAFLTHETQHPLVVQHPVTKRRLLFVGPYAVRFAGMSIEESQPLIKYLYRHSQKPEFTMRWRWEPNQLAVWDNAACMHFGVQDYAGMRREMYRFEIMGARPVPADPALAGPWDRQADGASVGS
jgi:taurine dioxygenase